MGRTRTLTAAFVAVVALTLLAVRAEARRTTVSAEGHAVIVGGNRAVARSQAIAARCARPWRRWRARSAPPARATTAPPITRSTIARRRSCRARRVVSEDVDGNILQVQISADVDVEALQRGRRDAPAVSRQPSAVSPERERSTASAS